VGFALAVCLHVLAAARHPALPAASVADALAAAALCELVAPERLAPVAPACRGGGGLYFFLHKKDIQKDKCTVI
jgi:hypothetical protein